LGVSISTGVCSCRAGPLLLRRGQPRGSLLCADELLHHRPAGIGAGSAAGGRVHENGHAPAGGLWWIARGPGEDGALVAQSNAGPVTLEAVDRALSYLNQVRGAALRVP